MGGSVAISAVIRDPWYVPEPHRAEMLGDLAAGLADGRELGPRPEVVAECGHCGDVLFAVGVDQWALVYMAEATQPSGSVPRPRVHRFSSVLAVADAMAAHW